MENEANHQPDWMLEIPENGI